MSPLRTFREAPEHWRLAWHVPSFLLFVPMIAAMIPAMIPAMLAAMLAAMVAGIAARSRHKPAVVRATRG